MKHSDLLMVLLVTSLLTMGGILDGANVLGLLPAPFYSHTNAYMPIFIELAARGHNVTLYTPFPIPKPVKNLHHVLVPNVLPDGAPNVIQYLSSGFNLNWFGIFGFWHFGVSIAKDIAKLKPLKDLAADKDSQFDVVLAETFFMQEPMVAFGARFSAPVINLNPATPTAWVSYLTGTPNLFSYVPDMRLALTDKMTFWERFSSTYLGMMDIFLGRYFAVPQMESIVESLFPGRAMPPMIDMLMNGSLTLVDAHFSMGYPRPYHANIIEIGGLSATEDKDLKPIPEDILDFMEGAEEGVIYFSLGSWLRASDLNAEQLAALIQGFASLKQRVLWKWDGGPLYGKPTNVLLAPWFPQNSILAHPKTLCFVTHGGIHSLFESIYKGVPLVGIPLMADQPYNLKFIEDEGLGLSLPLSQLTATSLREAVNTVIGDPRYKERVVARASILKDRPGLALKNAIYWIEYVISQKGPKHLRPSSVDIGWARYLLLDVVALFALVVVGILCLAILSICLFCRFCKWICCRRAKDISERKKVQ